MRSPSIWIHRDMYEVIRGIAKRNKKTIGQVARDLLNLGLKATGRPMVEGIKPGRPETVFFPSVRRHFDDF